MTELHRKILLASSFVLKKAIKHVETRTRQDITKILNFRYEFENENKYFYFLNA